MEIISLVLTHNRNLVSSVSSILCLILFVGNTCALEGQETLDESKDGPSATAEEIRRKWGAVDIVRDLDHIREDVSKVMKLQETGVISSNEALFYFFRMHDFDDNKKLDGLELVAAVRHSLDHSSEVDHQTSIDELVTIVDSFFSYDENSDGFLTYPEMRKNLGDDTKQ
ncbi:longistatin-like [Tachypleus tridentatus]|uniref:longistatin-like n=1 Tax=Tachypleus tridentatus TaxID=6853 RepID=UPI003FD1A193